MNISPSPFTLTPAASRFLQSSVALLFAAVAASCGGGGEDTTSSAPAPGGTQTGVDAAFQELNRLRAAAGAGALAANEQLTRAADSHALYLAQSALRTDPTWHVQVQGRAGFTAATHIERAAAAGYPSQSSVGEVLAQGLVGTDTPLSGIRSLMNLPYHGLSMLAGFNDVGMGARNGAPNTWLVVNLGAKPGAYVPVPKGEVRMWPCNGVTSILNRSVDTERPNPIAGRNLMTDPIGTPIYIMIADGSRVTLSSYEIRNLVTGEVSAVAKVLGQDASDNLQSHELALLPNRPLATSTTYSVTVSGLNAGVAFTKTCQFTTGQTDAS